MYSMVKLNKESLMVSLTIHSVQITYYVVVSTILLLYCPFISPVRHNINEVAWRVEDFLEIQIYVSYEL